MTAAGDADATVFLVTAPRSRAAEALAALERQTRPGPRFEVVVVESAAHGERALGEALAAAARAPSADICVFLPAGLLPGAAHVAAHVAAHRDGARVVAAGAPPAAVHGPVELRDLGGASLSLRRDALAPPAPGPAPVAELVLGLLAAGNDVRLVDDGGTAPTRIPSRAALAQRAAEGAAHASFAARRPAARRLLLAWFSDTTPRELLLRRSLLSVGARPGSLAALAPAAPGAPARARWAAFVADYAYWHGVRRRLASHEWRRLARATPVLLYHAFGDEPRASRFVLSPSSLRLQLRVLALLGYRVTAFDKLVQSLRSGKPLPPRTVVLTADDGYTDNRVLAAALARHRFRGTIFLVSDRLGRRVDWTDSEELVDRPLLTAEQVADLGPSLELGAHTCTHVSLPDAADDAIEAEVRGCREELERVLGAPVVSFAYPFGRHDPRAVAAVRRAGFAGACTVAGRPARLSDDPLQVPRIEIERSDSLPQFLRKVWFGAR